MATGRTTKITGQTGEYLVAAELSRRGLITTTFTGNVPHYDIIASNAEGQHVSVQVKSSQGGSWQFGNIGHFCEIDFDEKRQLIGNKKESQVKRLIVIFVTIKETGHDRFYILTWERLRDLLVKGHEKFLERHDNVRPRRWNSMHAQITDEILCPHQDKWDVIFKNLE